MKIEEFKEALKLYVSEHLELNAHDLRNFDVYEFKINFMVNNDQVIFNNPTIDLKSYQGEIHARLI